MTLTALKGVAVSAISTYAADEMGKYIGGLIGTPLGIGGIIICAGIGPIIGIIVQYVLELICDHIINSI